MKKFAKKIYKWTECVRRQQSLLMLDYIMRGLPSSNTKKVLGLKKGFEKYLYLDKLVLWDEEEVKNVSAYINQFVQKKDYPYLKRLSKKWLTIAKGLITLAVKLAKKNNIDKSNEKLAADLNLFSQQNWQLSTSLLIPLIVEKFLSAEIEKVLESRGLSKTKKEGYFKTLTYPKKDSTSSKELISFYKIASLFQKELAGKAWTAANLKKAAAVKDIKQALVQHLDNFRWIGARGYIGHGWTIGDLLARLVKQEPKENFQKKFKELKKFTEKNNQETQRIIKELNLAKKEIELLVTAKAFVFIRTYRTDTFYRAGFIARPFFNEIAKRLGISFGQLIYLESQEIMRALRGKEKVGLTKIKQRQKGFGALLENEKFTVFEGKEMDEFRQRQKIQDVSQTIPRGGLKGMVANPGKVRGRVKVVMSKDELGKVKKGDILITAMTTPDFVPAMERAAAFVTNEGGITCHAAIVSREMQKPCIIGTKIATKVLKDGDMVEVDAEKGVIKILKQ